jgi:hypothetical protein
MSALTPAEWGAILGGVPAIVAAITALIWAIRGKTVANAALKASISTKATAQNAYSTSQQAWGLASSTKDVIQAHVEYHNPAQPPATRTTTTVTTDTPNQDKNN